MKNRIQKSIIIFLLLTPLHAIAEFQISAQLQQEFVNWQSDPARLEGKVIDDGGQYQNKSTGSGDVSYIALSAQETLKNNKHGIVYVSLGLSPDDHTTTALFGREAYLGFKNEMSTWTFGTQSTAYKMVTSSWDPLWGTFMQARGNGGASLLHNGYEGNSINYRSVWWGADLAYSWSVDDSDADSDGVADRNDLHSISLTFPQGRSTYVIAYQDDNRVVAGHATKLGYRYEFEKDWTIATQIESLGGGVGDGKIGFASFIYQDAPDLQYTFNLGAYNSNNNTTSPSLNYAAFGIKYAFTKKAITHYGLRYTNADTNSNENEYAWGLGLRYRF